MPVRIYDIAKKLGIPPKDVLAKDKELGIAAKVPSSSLDKITGEFLELQLAASLPEISADGLTWTIRLKKGIQYHRNACFGAARSTTKRKRFTGCPGAISSIRLRIWLPR